MSIAPRLLPFLPALLATSLAAQSGWSTAVLEPALNSTAADTGPHLSLDGLTLHFASFRSSNWEIYSSTRTAPGQPWAAPVQETVLGGTTVEDQPFLDATGLEIWFSTTNRPGGTGSSDIMSATRATPTSPWNVPTFVTAINSTAAESAPSLTADGLEVFFLSTGWGNPAGNNNQVFVATRPSTAVPFNTPTLVVEFTNANTHRDCEVAADGLTIVYTEFTASRIKVLYSERLTRTSPWSPPVIWTEFDTTGTSLGVYSFTRSFGGNEAYLAAGFAAASGGQEIMRSVYTGLTHQGGAGVASTMSIGYHDPLNPNAFFSIGAAMGNTGFMVGTRLVPLDPDWLLIATFGQSVPGYSTGWGGQLDAAGDAIAGLTNGNPAFTGLQLWIGGLTWDANQPFGVGTIMNSFKVQLQ